MVPENGTFFFFPGAYLLYNSKVWKNNQSQSWFLCFDILGFVTKSR